MSFKCFDNNVKVFMENGFIDGLPLSPDAKHTILRQGLLDYYNTYHSLRDGFYEYLHKYPNGTVEISKAKGHEFLMRYFSAISFIQLFIELSVKEILEKINPVLVYGSLDKNTDTDIKERKFITYIKSNNIVPFVTLENDHTIEYSKGLKRLIKLIKSDDKIPDRFRVDPKYHFFAENAAMLDHLAGIRNEILHKASRTIAKYPWELLFVNYIIPFINTWLYTQDDMTMLERRLHRNINVLDSLCEIKLEVDCTSISKYDKIQKNLRHINHLKELGRASYHNPMHMWETLSEENRKNVPESWDDKPRRLQAEKLAKSKKDEGVFYNLNICSCCGVKSLGSCVDLLGDIFAYCDNCSYQIYEKELGEPCEFDLAENKIFEYIPVPEKKYYLLQRIWRAFIRKLCGCTNK